MELWQVVQAGAPEYHRLDSLKSGCRSEKVAVQELLLVSLNEKGCVSGEPVLTHAERIASAETLHFAAAEEAGPPGAEAGSVAGKREGMGV